MSDSYRFRHVARMEWIKLRTLRSVRWTLLFALAGMIGIGIAAGFNTKNPNGDVTNNILGGGALGSVLFAVLGVLVMTRGGKGGGWGEGVGGRGWGKEVGRSHCPAPTCA